MFECSLPSLRLVPLPRLLALCEMTQLRPESEYNLERFFFFNAGSVKKNRQGRMNLFLKFNLLYKQGNIKLDQMNVEMN